MLGHRQLLFDSKSEKTSESNSNREKHAFPAIDCVNFDIFSIGLVHIYLHYIKFFKKCLIFNHFCCCFSVAWCIKCYECDSMTQPQCGEYFSPKEIEESDCSEDDLPRYLSETGLKFEPTGCLTKVHEGSK